MPDTVKPESGNPNAGICAIAVMAKAPQPGRSKTRLTPPLAPAQAAALSAAFLRDTTENISAAGQMAPIAGWAAYAPAASEALFEGHLAAGTRLILADGSPEMPPEVQGFGQCLLHAVAALLALGYGSVCVLNSDGPTLPTQYLAQAAHYLAQPGDRAVLGPAEDGGYYLLGVKQPHARLFSNIAWSTEVVAEQTRARVQDCGLDLLTLPSWYDVDDAAALDRLRRDLATAPSGIAPFAASATRACLQKLGLRAGPVTA